MYIDSSHWAIDLSCLGQAVASLLENALIRDVWYYRYQGISQGVKGMVCWKKKKICSPPCSGRFLVGMNGIVTPNKLVTPNGIVNPNVIRSGRGFERGHPGRSAQEVVNNLMRY